MTVTKIQRERMIFNALCNVTVVPIRYLHSVELQPIVPRVVCSH